MKINQKKLNSKKENSNKKNDVPSRDLLTIPVKHSDGYSISNISELIESFNGTAFQSRNLAKCLDIMLEMLRDPDRPTIFLALAGAMVPGGQKKIIRDMLDLNMVDVLVSTGANLYHDAYEAMGFHHYLAQKEVSDLELRKHQIDRMLDVYASNEDFLTTDAFIKNFTDSLTPRKYSTREYLNKLGHNLKDENSILKTASKKNIPIFCPAIADSSIGLSLAWHTQERYTQKREPIFIDTILDNLEILKYKLNSKKTGAIHIGGGVPKNYIQQIGPMAEILNLDVPSLSYGVQITTDDPKWGGLSGCTFKESQSWGKYTDKAHFSTVYMDATIGLPLLFNACLEKKDTWFKRDPLQVDINKDF